MIELPEGNWPRQAEPMVMDSGFLQRSASGGATTRINRKGNRYKVAFSYGPFPPTVARKFVSSLIAAKSEGIRVPYPLLEEQGPCGSPVVDGAGQSGTALNIRGLIPGYVCREYWLSIEDATGRHFLHNVKTGGRAASDGTLSVTLSEMLRHPFADGATINLAKPMVEGWIDGDEWGWQLSADRLVPISFTLEEAK